ncbi:hypothetical protein LPJ56_000726 [Coemansia sp. RSA 2599]|nr:hypothetical protein LPJ75_000509 [Coemansia sp. RSA 2598]KAJ1828997.1 hypothetical protein LPJ56_000726 [Coemansia sp. RSA 2599]
MSTTAAAAAAAAAMATLDSRRRAQIEEVVSVLLITVFYIQTALESLPPGLRIAFISGLFIAGAYVAVLILIQIIYTFFLIFVGASLTILIFVVFALNSSVLPSVPKPHQRTCSPVLAVVPAVDGSDGVPPPDAHTVTMVEGSSSTHVAAAEASTGSAKANELVSAPVAATCAREEPPVVVEESDDNAPESRLSDSFADRIQHECMDTSWICDQESPFDMEEPDNYNLEVQLANSLWKRALREWVYTPLIADEEPPIDIDHPSVAAYNSQGTEKQIADTSVCGQVEKQLDCALGQPTFARPTVASLLKRKPCSPRKK